jgi:hypothetical protein
MPEFLTRTHEPPALAHVVNIIDPCRDTRFGGRGLLRTVRTQKIPLNLSDPRRANREGGLGHTRLKKSCGAEDP